MILPNEEQDAGSVAQHYDDLASFYLDAWGEHLHHGLWQTGKESPAEAVVALVTKVAAEARIATGARVCDIGCGYGATARLLAKNYRAHVAGVTVSPWQYEYAVEKTAGVSNPRFFLADWLQNPFPENSFDAVIAIESSEHMANKLKFFREIARVLRPGGRCVVAAWLAREAPKKWQVRHLLEPICREGRLTGLGTAKDYRKLASKARLRLKKFTDLTGQVQRTWPISIGRFVAALVVRSDYRRYFFSRQNENRVFAKTVFRIWAAYLTGSMRYGLFTFTKSSAPRHSAPTS